MHCICQGSILEPAKEGGSADAGLSAYFQCPVEDLAINFYWHIKNSLISFDISLTHLNCYLLPAFLEMEQTLKRSGGLPPFAGNLQISGSYDEIYSVSSEWGETITSNEG